ncbi:hypothetical protein I3760_03G193400 [Carya illinoinensis]|nr:hypothetical protein I3760_03G193400 [Carya illinoinensis]
MAKVGKLTKLKSVLKKWNSFSKQAASRPNISSISSVVDDDPPVPSPVTSTQSTSESHAGATSSAPTWLTTRSSGSSWKGQPPATRKTPSTWLARWSCLSTCSGCSRMPIHSPSHWTNS